MEVLKHMIDVDASECAVITDYEREMKVVRELEGGSTGVNALVAGVVVGALFNNILEIDAFVCNEPESFRALNIPLGCEGDERKLAKEGHAWNFGPKKSNFVKVSQVISKMNEIKKFKKISIKKDKIKETKILKLNSSKAIKYLNWWPRWSIDKTLKKIIDWNNSEKKKESLKKIFQQKVIDI